MILSSIKAAVNKLLFNSVKAVNTYLGAMDAAGADGPDMNIALELDGEVIASIVYDKITKPE